MRIRTIKPEFFRHEVLCSLPALTRILFAGLWGLADRRGRLEDRARRIKVEVLPYDNVDVDALLDELADKGFIIRYMAGDLKLIEIPSFEEHQRITGKEAETESKFPQPLPKKQRRSTREASGKQPGNTGETTETTGREGKGREGNGVAPIEPARVQTPFDALVEFEGLGPKLNSSEGGRIGKALKLIRETTPEVSADEVHRRGAAYKHEFPRVSPTAMGLAGRWSKFETAKFDWDNDGRQELVPGSENADGR